MSHTNDSFDALLLQAMRVSVSAGSRTNLLSVGTTLAGGRLSILRKLGEGGMGVVYEAVDSQRRARVALKTLTRIDAPSVYRLKNEFRVLADVTHPHLVQLYELFVDGETWFFTMELIEGESFDRWTRPEGRYDEARVRAALAQLLRGVAAIHAAGKLHRDLKPSNVLITAEGRLRILDFGLAVDPEVGGVGHTLAELHGSGTPAYMAPEQAAGEPARIASDHYAVGVMLFEALTGELPFQGRSGEVLAAKQHVAAPDPRSRAANLPDDLVSLCSALLAREPAARPDGQTMRKLAEAAKDGSIELGSGERTSAPPGALPELLGRARELEILRDAYAASLGGAAKVLFVTGESGIGKSALLETFLTELREPGQAVLLAGRCYERENVPYKGFDGLIDELSRFLRKLPLHEAAALMPREVYALARIFPVLGRIKVVADAPRKEVLDPQELKRRAFEAFGELLARLRDRAPVVVAIDDLQWVDQDSVRFMRALLLQPAPAPVLLVCMHRSEGAETHPLLQSVREAASQNPLLAVHDLAVGSLPHAALATLMRRLLPPNIGPGASEQLASEAQGSPFFATELARAALLQKPDKPALTLAEAVSLHVRSLAPEAQRLLSLLALAGQPLSPQRALQAVQLSEGHTHLDRLRAERLVRSSFDADGERRMECYHDKIREQVAAELDAELARELAGSLADALLAAASSDFELLSRLLELAGRLEQAAEHAAQAAQRAFAALAFTRAAYLYERALSHGRFTQERVQALRVARAEALAYAGQGARAGAAFVDAARGATEDRARELTQRAGEQYLACGELERGAELLAGVARQAGISFPRTRAGVVLSLLWWRLRLRLSSLRFTPRAQVDASTERALELLRTLTHGLMRNDQLRGAALCARWVLRALAAGNALELGRALSTEFIFTSMMNSPNASRNAIESLCEQLVEQTGDELANRQLAYGRGVHLLIKLGDWEAALAELDDSLIPVSANSSWMVIYNRPWAQYFRAFALAMGGRLVEAGQHAQRQIEDAVARGDHTLSVSFTGIVVVAWLAADRPAAAAELLERERTRLRTGQEAMQDFQWLLGQAQLGMYLGRARDAWYAAEAHRNRYLSSFAGRWLFPGALESFVCGVAVAAAHQAEGTAERASLTRAAELMARRARRATFAPLSVPTAALACLRGDRSGAIVELREHLPSVRAPLTAAVLRRQLGKLLADDEGAALIAQADALLRAAGVVDITRFTSASAPGLEIP